MAYSCEAQAQKPLSHKGRGQRLMCVVCFREKQLYRRKEEVIDMKYNEITGKVRALYPNEYTDEEMLEWIDEVNSDIRRNVEKNQVIHKKAKGTDNSIIPPPYDSMYMYYVLAQIAYHQKDFDL